MRIIKESKANYLINERRIHKKRELHEFYCIGFQYLFPDGKERICNEFFVKNFM